MWRSQRALTQLIGEHVERRSAMEPRDVYKLLYQGILGLEHLVASPEGFAARLRAEYEGVSADNAELLWETVRPDGTLGRLNLRPFKAREGDVELLTAACLHTAGQVWGTPDELRAAWATFADLCRAGQWPAFSLPEVLAFSAWIEEREYPAAHHSSRYREEYRPAYRLVASEFLELQFRP
jgi:hypothetical protein